MQTDKIKINDAIIPDYPVDIKLALLSSFIFALSFLIWRFL